jgi:hypothetical protein
MLLLAGIANLLLRFAWTAFVHALWQNSRNVCRCEQLNMARRRVTD